MGKTESSSTDSQQKPSYAKRVEPLASSTLSRYVGAVFAVAAATALLAVRREHINSATVGLGFLLVVLFVAILWGSKPALLASVLGMLSFNFFFLPPVYTLTIADPQNWVTVTAFFITAVAVGQLSARARRRAEEAEAGRREIRRLYEELQDAFERASEAEALRRNERLKSALLDAVTHDLRTPLTAIKASATLLLEDREMTGQTETLPPDEQRVLLKVITKEADKLDRFVEGIVGLARIEAGELELFRNWGAVDEIIDAALTRAESLTSKHVLTTLLEDELPSVRVDARAVAEVVYTLIENAAKYSPAGTRISVEANRSSDETVQIAVEDQGPGIPLNLRERVFERFFQAAEPGVMTRGRASGLGLGLAIARGIVEAHGGHIWIESATGGHGTRVIFTVPVGDDESPVDNDTAAARTGNAAQANSNGK
jgi:K+-sensing histidine kinase KdpD